MLRTRWRLEAHDGRSPEINATTVPAVESADAHVATEPVEAVGDPSRQTPNGADLVEATLIPTILFYTFFVAFGLLGAIVAALGWTYRPWAVGSSPDGRFPAC